MHHIARYLASKLHTSVLAAILGTFVTLTTPLVNEISIASTLGQQLPIQTVKNLQC